MKRIIITLLSLLLAFSAMFLVIYPMLKKPKAKPAVKSFQECAATGYPVMESYPRQCRDSAGVMFTEILKEGFQ
jgi:hypothetical protein